MGNFGIVCAILAAVFTTGVISIKCYDCFDCNIVNHRTPTTTCDVPPDASNDTRAACYTGTGFVNGDEEATIIRGCRWSTSFRCFQENHPALKGEYCYCSRDLCNGDGSGNGASSIVKLNVVLMMFVTGIFVKIFA
ncbi:uncharacterized protein LOC120347753 [Styela clava]